MTTNGQSFIVPERKGVATSLTATWHMLTPHRKDDERHGRSSSGCHVREVAPGWRPGGVVVMLLSGRGGHTSSRTMTWHLVSVLASR